MAPAQYWAGDAGHLIGRDWIGAAGLGIEAAADVSSSASQTPALASGSVKLAATAQPRSRPRSAAGSAGEGLAEDKLGRIGTYAE